MPGDAELHDVGLLLRRQLPLQPDEAGAALQLVIGLLVVEIGQHRRQLLDRLVGVDDAARLGKQRGRLDVGRQHLAVAVDDIGPRRGDARLRARRDIVGVLQAEIDQPPGDAPNRCRRTPPSSSRRASWPCRRSPCARHRRRSSRFAGPGATLQQAADLGFAQLEAVIIARCLRSPRDPCRPALGRNCRPCRPAVATTDPRCRAALPADPRGRRSGAHRPAASLSSAW